MSLLEYVTAERDHAERLVADLERQLAEAREWAKTVSHTATCRRQDFVGGYDEAACGRCQIARILKEE